MTSDEDEILSKYSTPGLKRTELDRGAKRDQLRELRVSEEEIAKILDQLYPQQGGQ